jgi:hypothetical protein
MHTIDPIHALQNTGIYENVKLQHTLPYKPACFANSDDGLMMMMMMMMMMMSDNKTCWCNNKLLRPTQPPTQWMSGVLSPGGQTAGPRN